MEDPFVSFSDNLIGDSVGIAEKDIEIISFYRGYVLWQENLSLDKMPYNLDQLMQGIRAAARGDELQVSDEKNTSLIQKFQLDLVASRNEENLVEANNFIKTIFKESTELIPNKLYFKKIKDGSGRALGPEDSPFVIYRVKTIEDGAERDIFSSDNLPIQMNLSDTILGFQEGVIGMLEGEKRILYIHPDLGQGNYGFLFNKVLIIEIEIIQIEKPTSH